MRIFQFSALVLALSFSGANVYAASANFNTYRISPVSLPCSGSACYGFISLSGTITTDNTGTLSPSDIVVWDLMVALYNDPPIELFQGNSTFGITGAPLINANQSELTITLNSAQDGFIFAGPVKWFYSWDGRPYQVLTYPSEFYPVAFAAQPYSNPVTFTATALSIVEAPEPSSFLLMSLASLLYLAVVMVRPNRELSSGFKGYQKLSTNGWGVCI